MWLNSLPPVLVVVAALAITWALTTPPWSLRVAVGGADSALLGPGFYTREVTTEGVPFRWTNGPAVFRVPYLRSSAIVSIRADTATGKPYTVKLLDGQRRLATFEAQPGFRTYQVLWPSPISEFGLAGLSARDFTVLAEARPLRENDNRLYGIAISAFAAHELAYDNVPLAPMLVVALALVGLAGVLWPLRGVRQAVFAAVAVALPLLYALLVWHPPTNDVTWLPLAWLPWFVALALTGLALTRLAQAGRRGALAACLVVVGVFGLLLLSLHSTWNVDGPDYGWHLNHGGSWPRVFRAHRFYPFGFPLILYVGELAGNQPLAFGRITGAVSAVIGIGATVALVWRLYGRKLAWLGGVVLLGAPIFVAYGVLASTDAPAAAWASLALLALCWNPTPGWRSAAFGGAALGVAYLFRFQAIVLLAPIGLWLLTQPRNQRPLRLIWLQRTGRLALPLILFAAFVLATSPQWLLDIRDFGRPFFTAQYVNIWTFGYGKQDGLPDGSALAQIWYIVNYDPALLWRHWAENLRQAASETLNASLLWPFGTLALAGAAIGLLSLRDRRHVLLALWLAVYVSVVALTYNKERFYLPVLPALVVFVVGLTAKLDERLATSRWQSAAVSATAVALWCWSLLHLADAQQELILYLLQ